jgi:hypothetical protein
MMMGWPDRPSFSGMICNNYREQDFRRKPLTLFAIPLHWQPGYSQGRVGEQKGKPEPFLRKVPAASFYFSWSAL